VIANQLGLEFTAAFRGRLVVGRRWPHRIWFQLASRIRGRCGHALGACGTTPRPCAKSPTRSDAAQRPTIEGQNAAASSEGATRRVAAGVTPAPAQWLQAYRPRASAHPSNDRGHGRLIERNQPPDRDLSVATLVQQGGATQARCNLLEMAC